MLWLWTIYEAPIQHLCYHLPKSLFDNPDIRSLTLLYRLNFLFLLLYTKNIRREVVDDEYLFFE